MSCYASYMYFTQLIVPYITYLYLNVTFCVMYHKSKMNTKKTRHLSKGLHIRLEDDIDDNTNGNFSITRSLSAANLDLNKRGRTTAKFEMEMVQRSTASLGRFDETRKGEYGSKNSREKLRLRCNTQTDKEKVFASAKLIHSYV